MFSFVNFIFSFLSDFNIFSNVQPNGYRNCHFDYDCTDYSRIDFSTRNKLEYKEVFSKAYKLRKNNNVKEFCITYQHFFSNCINTISTEKVYTKQDSSIDFSKGFLATTLSFKTIDNNRLTVSIISDIFN